MSYYEWRPYVPVAERRRKAEKRLAKLKTKGQSIDPIRIEGRTIAKSFWGKSWCTNLERYSDFESRLPRGRTYVRNGSVVDLQIAKGNVSAMVSGSELYRVTITIGPVIGARWRAICTECAGSIDSLVELLQGRLSKGVMDRVCREGDGLFPAPREIKMSCNCLDWAGMCKHVAAVLYGVGARLDDSPSLLFKLRGVDESELLANAGQEVQREKAALTSTKMLDDGDVAALFGLEMAESVKSDTPAGPKRQRRPKAPGGRSKPVGSNAVASRTGTGLRGSRRGTPPRPPSAAGQRKGKKQATAR